MKFTDGYWLTKEGYNLNYPMEAYSHIEERDSLRLFLPHKKIKSRGDTLNIGMTTANFTSPLEDVVKVELIHHDLNEKSLFELEEQDVVVNINTKDKENYSFTSGDLEVKIPKNDPFKIEFYGKDQLLTSSEHRAQAVITSDDGKHYMREQLSLDPYANVYGMGERFTSFVKNGQVVDIWNEDGGTGSEQAYKNIPFYITNDNYGVFVNHSENVSFEVASENVSRTQFSVEGQKLEYLVIYGENMKEILTKYTDLTGKPSLPPAWSFGLWLSTSFTTDYSEETIMRFIDEMQSRDIPFDVFHFDTFWMKEFEWCGFEWNEEMFPDPKGMIDRIHEKGLEVCLWINPYIGQKSPAYKVCKDNGYFIKRQDGEVWQWDMWQSGQGIIDFTNPEACEWYVGKLQELIDLGVDSFKTDFGERIPTDCVYYDGSDPYKMHNYYSYLYNKVVFEHLEKEKGKNNAILFARSGSVGSQKFPVHWGGDNLSEYPSMAESLRGGLSLLLSGFGYWSHDIGGFEDNTEPDLYKRWTQFGLLSTHSRYHGNIEYRVPWNFGEEAALVTQKFSKLKNKLMPYLYKEAIVTSKTGIPMMRPLILEFEQDYNVHTIDKEYMLGDSLLIAPIFNENNTVDFYVPGKGNWTNILDDKIYEGGKWYTEKYDYFNLPLLARPNSLIIEGDNNQTADYDYSKNIIVHAYEIYQETSTKVYDNNAELIGSIYVKPKGSEIDVQVEGLENVTIVFHNQIFENTEVIENNSKLIIK